MQHLKIAGVPGFWPIHGSAAAVYPAKNYWKSRKKSLNYRMKPRYIQEHRPESELAPRLAQLTLEEFHE
ncbi:hypothetical protein [Terracidiphilus sp.]|jgi:hypothetical protein|uniref:hypothetical protein n=1 Tax=Terracidiphilus sp. TaxID=1964191 RepID=UPI003C227E7F